MQLSLEKKKKTPHSSSSINLLQLFTLVDCFVHGVGKHLHREITSTENPKRNEQKTCFTFEYGGIYALVKFNKKSSPQFLLFSN